MPVCSLLTLSHCLLYCNSLTYLFLNQQFSSGDGVDYKNGGMVLKRNLKAYNKARIEAELV